MVRCWIRSLAYGLTRERHWLTRPENRFKIQQDGYNNGNWGTTEVITNGGLHSIKIPDCIADGEYLLRAEMIALHGAGSPGGAQFYVSCCFFYGFLPGLSVDSDSARTGLNSRLTERTATNTSNRWNAHKLKFPVAQARHPPPHTASRASTR